MTPQNARIWFVSPDEPHNKTAYFVNAPYQVDKITPQRFTQWQQLGSGISLSLPALNPYIPDDFTLTKTSHEFKSRKWWWINPPARAVHAEPLLRRRAEGRRHRRFPQRQDHGFRA